MEKEGSNPCYDGITLEHEENGDKTFEACCSNPCYDGITLELNIVNVTPDYTEPF